MNDCITPRLSPQEREEREAYFASQKLREQRAEPPELPPSVSLLDLLDQAQAEQRRLTAALAARDERIRELEAEAEKIRDTAVSIELVKVASVDLVQDADGRDRAVLSTSWGIGLHRQHNCDEEGCGCWHVIARPPLSVESRVALLDLRSAKDDAKRERDEARTRIATLERELAEARQRDEDATDLILRQGRELAAMRTKAEAAERFSMVVRHRKACLEQGKKWKRSSQWAAAVDAILAACPEKGGAL